MSKRSLVSGVFNVGDAVKKAAENLKKSRLRELLDKLPDEEKKNIPAQKDEVSVAGYHGTATTRDNDAPFFNIDFGRKQDEFLGEGFYFTIDPKVASEYANMRAINELDIIGSKGGEGLYKYRPTGQTVTTSSLLKGMDVDGKSVSVGQQVGKFDLSGIENPLIVRTNKQRLDAKENIAKIKEAGYDSIIFDNFKDRSKQILVFPEHIGKVDKDSARVENLDLSTQSQMISVFPKPEKLFPKGEAPKGGDYLNPATGEVITDRNVSSANIKINPDGKPSFKVSDDNVGSVGTTGKGNSQIKVNLFKKKAGWKWSKAPSGMEDIGTVVSVTHKGKHYYTFETDFTKGVNLKKYPNQKDEPKLRPTVVGKIELGEPVGEISVRGKPHKVYNTIKAFNKGGAAMSMNKQMEMFDLGGLRDQGGTIDPKSKNPVPVGSTQEEVRDDIPAQLSDGEVVLPADVVRYHGLEKIMGFRDQAKQGLQRMEQMGQMGNADEATIPDGVPFKSNSNPLVDEKRKMAIGGTTVNVPEIEMPKVEGVNVAKPATQTSRPSVFATGDTTQTNLPATDTTKVDVPTAPNYRVRTKTGDATTYGKLIGSEFGQQQKTETIKYVNPDTNEELYIPFVNGEPIYPIPAGYIPEADVPVEEEKEDPTKAVKTAQTMQTDDGGDDGGVRDIRTTERPVGEGGITNVLSALLTPTIGKVFDAFSAPPMSTKEKQDMLVNEFGFNIKTPMILGDEKEISPEAYIEKFGGGPFKTPIENLANIAGDLSTIDQSTLFSVGTKPGQIDSQTRGLYGTDGVAYNINQKTPALLGGAARDANGNIMYSDAKSAFNDLKVARTTGWYGGPISALAYMGLDDKAQDNYRAYQVAKGNKTLAQNLQRVGAPDSYKVQKERFNVGGNNFGAGAGTNANPKQGIYVGAGAGPAGVVTGSWTTNAKGEKQFSMDGGGTIIAGKTGVVGDFDGDGRPDPTVTASSPTKPTVVSFDGGDDGGPVDTGSIVSDPQSDAFESGFFTSSDQDFQDKSREDVKAGESIVGDDPEGPTDDCVIATHGLSTGGFTAMEKAKAELWCQKTYHGKWYGEAFRRGYRAAGMKHINAGTAQSVYQEFKDFVAYGRGIKRGWKLGFNYYLRTITFFFTGLFIK